MGAQYPSSNKHRKMQISYGLGYCPQTLLYYKNIVDTNLPFVFHDSANILEKHFDTTKKRQILILPSYIKLKAQNSILKLDNLQLCNFVMLWQKSSMAESADKNLYRRYIHQANVLLANFLSLLTFGLLFTGNVMY